MNALIAFLGSVTLDKLIIAIAAIVFLVKVYKIVSDFIIKSYKKKEMQERTIETLQMQQGEISNAVKNLTTMVQDIKNRQDKIDRESRERELNRLRDQLYQKYRYYKTNPDINTWTQSEHDIWMLMFKDYEELGGNGQMHQVVKPFMDFLAVVPDH